ncbi:MAG: response regulator [Magnetococcales bacterium]|nr:response regulator [Magnetococcales bacterium]
MASPGKPLVLVVDDTPDNLTLVVDLLKDHYRLKVANSGERALKAVWSAALPDLILLDIMMPGMDGYQVLTALKAEVSSRDVPVIFLTAKSEVDDEQKGLSLGAVDYITKPISPPILMARVRNQLELKLARDQLKNQNAVLDEKVRQRTQQLLISQQKLKKLVDIGIDISAEHDTLKLLETILMGGKELTHADVATLYLRTEDNTLEFSFRSNDIQLPTSFLPLYDPQTGQGNHHFIAVHVALSGESICLDDIYSDTVPFDVSGAKQFDVASGYHTQSVLAVALKPRNGVSVGVLQLLNAIDPDTGKIIPFHPELIQLAEALASQAGVLLDNHRLLRQQEQLFDAVIKVIASAIDAKSPYTGGHCERVPEIGQLLAQAACDDTSGPLADFSMTSDEWKAFQLAGWLHDCGKVTTPEYVVDKATKLETIYNRIHEIRMRFEVLRRDYTIDALQAMALPGADTTQIQADLAARITALEDDFAFVAQCNIGGEFMSPDKVSRLERIAGLQWTRYFDDRLGLSHVELTRLANIAAPSLPVAEQLLADKPGHIVPRQEAPFKYNSALGIRMPVPEHLYNYGELYNLRIARGTLSDEERFKVNEHIIYSIIMLTQLPFPKELQQVPDLAGSHHETLKGSGYPRQLGPDQLSVQARILAIADVFEALTASDRPYKKAKTLSEALKIMTFMVKDQHIDADLFALFLSSGVYLRYAERFLLPEQIDIVDSAKLTRD